MGDLLLRSYFTWRELLIGLGAGLKVLGSKERTTGWPIAWACARAWRFGDESQQPTCPQVKQSRRCSQGEPVRRHSSQPCGVRGLNQPYRGEVGTAKLLHAVLP